MQSIRHRVCSEYAICYFFKESRLVGIEKYAEKIYQSCISRLV
jgi:hypothetical protein